MSGSRPRPEDPSAPTAATASIDDGGFRLACSSKAVLDVLFDGRRIWSVASSTGAREHGEQWFSWPDPLRPYLDGCTRVTVREHVTGRTLADQEVAFGSGQGSVRVVDGKGRPLAVTKWGRMNHPFDAAGRHAVDAYLDHVEAVLSVLRDDCGLPAFLSYGSLLGAVRGGELIGHDVDVDLAYLSSHEYPVDVIRESFVVERALRRRGWKVRRENGGFLALWFSQPGGGTRNIDVFTCFFTEGSLLQPHDVWARMRRSAIVPLSSVRLEGREFPAPAEPSTLLRATYGQGWQTPDPAFKFKSPPATVRRVRGWLGGLRDHRDYWNKLYDHREDGTISVEPSPFAAWTHERESGTPLLVDIGCGNGRDALAFARWGHSILGLDYAGVGVRAGNSAARRESLYADFERCNLYDLRHALAMGARLALESRSKALYSRFLVEALENQGRHNLWRLAEMALRGGGRMYLEFRVQDDAETLSRHREDVRHLLPSQAVAEEIRRRGGQIEHREESRGLAHHVDGDPLVCRLVAAWL